MILHFKAAQNFVAEHYGIDFDMIFRLKATQNLVAEHYVRYFYMIFQFLRWLKPWLQSTLKEFLT